MSKAAAIKTNKEPTYARGRKGQKRVRFHLGLRPVDGQGRECPVYSVQLGTVTFHRQTVRLAGYGEQERRTEVDGQYLWLTEADVQSVRDALHLLRFRRVGQGRTDHDFLRPDDVARVGAKGDEKAPTWQAVNYVPVVLRDERGRVVRNDVTGRPEYERDADGLPIVDGPCAGWAPSPSDTRLDPWVYMEQQAGPAHVDGVFPSAGAADALAAFGDEDEARKGKRS